MAEEKQLKTENGKLKIENEGVASCEIFPKMPTETEIYMN